MNTLRDRLAELADDAPTSGAPAAELWARGKRAHRLRATALTSMVLVVVVGARFGVGLPEGKPTVLLAPGGAGGITLPIEYPVGEELPNLGDTPGPLAAVWLAPREAYTLDDDDAGRAPQAVGLVAETGTFGTLPIELHAGVYEAPNAAVALSPDGRRMAYAIPAEGGGSADDEIELVVWDLVSGDRNSPAFDFEARAGGTWVDSTHLVGHVAGGSDADGWVWDVREPATSAKLVDPYPYLENSEIHPPFEILESDPPWSCDSPTIRDRTGRSDASVLCDVLGVIDSDTLLGHVQSIAPHDANDLNRAVVALDVRHRADFPFDEPALRRVVATAGAPYPVSFATDLIAEALEVPPPAETAGISLPLEYPVGEELPDLGDTPGALAAVWLAPRVDGGPPEAVGLVAETGTFGTLPINVSYDHDEALDAALVALSNDGRRIAYESLTGGLIVRDLVSGENYASTPEFEPRAGFTWIETTLIGRVAGGGEREGWVWEPGTALRLIDPMTYELPNDALWFAQGAVGPGTRDHWVAVPGGGPGSCSPPILENHSDRSEVPELCDVLGFISGSGLLGHWNSDRQPGDWNDPDDGNGTVVAWGAWGQQSSDDPRVVIVAGAPERVAFAVNLIAEALDAGGGAP